MVFSRVGIYLVTLQVLSFFTFSVTQECNHCASIMIHNIEFNKNQKKLLENYENTYGEKFSQKLQELDCKTCLKLLRQTTEMHYNTAKIKKTAHMFDTNHTIFNEDEQSSKNAEKEVSLTAFFEETIYTEFLEDITHTSSHSACLTCKSLAHNLIESKKEVDQLKIKDMENEICLQVLEGAKFTLEEHNKKLHEKIHTFTQELSAIKEKNTEILRLTMRNSFLEETLSSYKTHCKILGATLCAGYAFISYAWMMQYIELLTDTDQ